MFGNNVELNNDQQNADEQLEVRAINRRFWEGKTEVRVNDAERAHLEVASLEVGVNRAIRHINRKANLNTKALNDAAANINTNMATLQAQIASLAERISLIEPEDDETVRSNDDRQDSPEPVMHAHEREHMVNPLVEMDEQDEFWGINTLTASGGIVEFGDDSVIEFDSWSDRFRDYIAALGRNWNDEEKVARLRLALRDTPRELFKQLKVNETVDVETALAALRTKLDSPQRRELAKRSLSLCRQREGESISQFVKRLKPLVEVVHSSLDKKNLSERVCEEFLDRVRPNVGFLIRLVGLSKQKDFELVKAQAEELETLLIAEKANPLAELTQSVHAVQTSSSSTPSNSSTQNRFNPSSRTQNFDSRKGNYQRNRPQGRNVGNWGGQNRYFNSNRTPLGNRNWGRNGQRQMTERNWSNRPICNFCRRPGYLAYACRDRQMQFRRENNNRSASVNAIQPSSASTISMDPNELIRAIANLQIASGTAAGSSETHKSAPMNALVPVCKSSATTNAGSVSEISEQNSSASSRSPRTSDWEGIGPKLARYMTICLCLLALFIPNSALRPTHPMVCQTSKEGMLWSLPAFRGCPKISLDHSIVPMSKTLWLYAPNAFEHETPAWACRKVRKSLQKSTSLSGLPLANPLEPEFLEVSGSECRQMIEYNKCTLGTLKNESGLLHTDRKIDNTPRTWFIGSWNWETVSSENCYLFKVLIRSKFGDPTIHVPLGDTPNCPYAKGSCLLEDNTLVLWKPNTKASCQFKPVGKWMGHIMGHVWIADDAPLLLDFGKDPKIIPDCGQNLTLSDQGFAAYSPFSDAIPNRAHRRMFRQKRMAEGMVTSSQLQSELSYLQATLIESLQFSFDHALRSLCSHLEEVRKWAVMASLYFPTDFARLVFANPNLIAKRVSNEIIKVWPCVPLGRDDYSFAPLEEIQPESKQCFDKLPVKFLAGGKQKYAFLDSTTMMIESTAREGSCSEYRHQLVDLGNETIEVDQLTASVRKVVANRLSNLTGELPAMPTITAHAFHQFVLANVTDILTHSYVNSMVERSQITYQIHNRDKSIIIAPSQDWSKVRDDVNNWLFGGWLSIFWRVAAVVLAVLLADFLLRMYFMFKGEYEGTGKRFWKKAKGESQSSSRDLESAVTPTDQPHTTGSQNIEYTPIVRLSNRLRSYSLKRKDRRLCRTSHSAQVNVLIRKNDGDLEEEPVELPVVPCEINEIPMLGLLDTGAQISIAPSSLANKITMSKKV